MTEIEKLDLEIEKLEELFLQVYNFKQYTPEKMDNEQSKIYAGLLVSKRDFSLKICNALMEMRQRKVRMTKNTDCLLNSKS